MRNHEACAIKNKATFVFTCIDAPSTLATQATRSRKVTATGTATKKPLQKALAYLLTQPCDCAIPANTKKTSTKVASRKVKKKKHNQHRKSKS